MLWKKRKKRTGEAARRAAAVLGKGQFWLKNMAVMAAVTVCGAAALRAHRSWMEEKAAQQELAASVIRFHVLADSDRQRDQQVKLEVRDAFWNGWKNCWKARRVWKLPGSGWETIWRRFGRRRRQWSGRPGAACR